MKNGLPTRDPIGKAQRRSRAERRIGYGSKCACGESRPEALIADSVPMACAECKRRQKGQSITDRHHVAGRANHDLTIPVLANDHRAILTPAMYDWPKETRENPTGSPLLAAAGCIRGFCDTVVYLIEKLILWIAELLENLHEQLTCILGDNYWQVLKTGFAKGLR
jgi:hypothetical protein